MPNSKKKMPQDPVTDFSAWWREERRPPAEKEYAEAGLTELEAEVVFWRFRGDGWGSGLTLHDVGEILGRSRLQVRAIERRALRKVAKIRTTAP